jgi:hypothetical protein
MPIAQHDPVRDFLRQQGAPYHFISSGLRGLVENWERVADMVVKGYDLPLDDYLADMDTRELLANALDVAPPALRETFRDRITRADERMKAAVIPAGRCLWGQIVADEEGWREDREWWYFTRPRQAGPRLLEELHEA